MKKNKEENALALIDKIILLLKTAHKLVLISEPQDTLKEDFQNLENELEKTLCLPILKMKDNKFIGTKEDAAHIWGTLKYAIEYATWDNSYKLLPETTQELWDKMVEILDTFIEKIEGDENEDIPMC